MGQLFQSEHSTVAVLFIIIQSFGEHLLPQQLGAYLFIKVGKLHARILTHNAYNYEYCNFIKLCRKS